MRAELIDNKYTFCLSKEEFLEIGRKANSAEGFNRVLCNLVVALQDMAQRQVVAMPEAILIEVK